MVGASYAAVPLYDWFCRTTGFAGIPLVAVSAPEQALDEMVTVRFDANTTGGLPWKFTPDQTSIRVKIGEPVTVSYTVINQSARETVGLASYNVAPPIAGSYFNKINCFCFTDQRLKPGEKREMTVVFFVDPAVVKDADRAAMNTITLSYTMYPVRDPAPPVVERATTAGRS
jgi:cytochrome c oxidase assembly protein subunit 11